MPTAAIRALFALLLVACPIAMIGCDTPSTPSNVTPGPAPAANYPSDPAAKAPPAPTPPK